MKRILTAIILTIPFLSVFAATPKWISSHESSATEYYGLGMASMNSGNYIEYKTRHSCQWLKPTIKSRKHLLKKRKWKSLIF